jgi:hypothetical protein
MFNSKKIFLAITILFALSVFNHSVLATGSFLKPGTDQKDIIIRTVSVTIVNATIYNDRDTGSGEIFFKILIENEMFTSPITYKVDSSNTGNNSIQLNWKINKTLTSNIDLVEIEVWDDDGVDTIPNPDDYLGNINITNIPIDGSKEMFYNTSSADSDPDPQALLYITTGITEESIFFKPIIELQTETNLTFLVGTQGKYLNFSFYDDNPDYFQLEKDGVIVFKGGWKNNETILFLLDNLNTGKYNFTLTAFDIYASKNSVTIWVTVQSSAVSTSGINSGTETSTNTAGRTNRSIDYPSIPIFMVGMMFLIVILKKRE